MILIGRGLDLRARWFVKEAERSERRRQKREQSKNSRNEWKCSLGQITSCAVLRVRKGEIPTENPNISGDNSLRDPPVPIPNTEVKPQHADSTWLETAR